MNLDISKLENVGISSDGKQLRSACPVCLKNGWDYDRNNFSKELPNGPFRCWTGCDNREIFKMVGIWDGKKRFRPYEKPISKQEPVTSESAKAMAERFLGSFKCTENDLIAASPIKISGKPAESTVQVLENLFEPHELLNLCPSPGRGITRPRSFWVEFIRRHGVAGNCFWRPNALKGPGTGANGGVGDFDVLVHRFLVLENDLLPLDLQTSLLGRLALPIAAITFSGGKSYHCLIKVDCPDSESYRVTAKELLSLLRPLGFDPATGNPSRLSRLPGGFRSEKKQVQRLLYLNPAPTENSILKGGSCS